MWWRICWAASTNASFRGASDWERIPEDMDADTWEQELSRGGSVSEGLEAALEWSGFEWWVETQESD
jgi:hypothetical protein